MDKNKILIKSISIKAHGAIRCALIMDLPAWYLFVRSASSILNGSRIKTDGSVLSLFVHHLPVKL